MSQTPADISGSMSGGFRATAALASRILERPAARLALICGFALLTWAGAKISVPLPGTPVPGTLQTLAVLMAGALLCAPPRAGRPSSLILFGMAGLPGLALPRARPADPPGAPGGGLFRLVAAPL